MIKIVIADDHPIFRQGIKQAIDLIPNTRIVSESSNGMEAYHSILSQIPDIAILDLEMPILNGLDVCAKVKSELSSVKIIIITMHKEKHCYQDAIKAGVNGYLLKDNAIEDLILCIKAVLSGTNYISPNIESYLIDADQQSTIEKINKLLTPTEKIILKLIADGKKSSEIADLLFCSPNTVENHRSNMVKKLELDGGKNGLMKYAIGIKSYL
jgi:DNA-binding NarL/FixJ family response regulator